MRAFLLAFLLSLIPSLALAQSPSTLNFNTGWKFIKSNPDAAQNPSFDDARWDPVSCPHTFNDVDTFDDWSPPGHVGEMNQWSGVAWYRKTFTASDAWKSQRILIEFQAVRQIADVYLNGVHLGQCRNGFIPFGYDLTPHLRFDNQPNVLAVRVDNRFTDELEFHKIGLTELPWNSPHWHPAHGGIYRNVLLHIKQPVSFSLPLYNNLQTVGIYTFATNVSSASADIGIDAQVENTLPADAPVRVQAELLDAQGKTLLTLDASDTIPHTAAKILSLRGQLPSPIRWEPDYPYLYTLRITLQQNGKTIDTHQSPLGIRSVRWDVQNGFFINEHHLKLLGWGQKPTNEWPGLGAAFPDWMHHYTLQLMKDAGGNFVRWGHCASGPADIAAGDQLGIIALQPGVDGESDGVGDAWKIRADAFRDMIVYFRNHPSILIWEGGNQKVTRQHAAQLRGIVDRYDPHGSRAFAHRRADKTTGEFMQVTIGTEGSHECPNLPVVEGEYNREESPRRVWDDFSPPDFGYPAAKGQTYQLTSEQFAVNEITHYMKKIAAPDHCGGANWIFSDSTSGGRVACEVCRCSGEVDAVRLPKEAYYACQAIYRPDPQLHIVGHWSYPTDRPTTKTIYVISNTEQVELFVNGKSLGKAAPTDRFLFTFPNVQFQPGEIKAIGYRNNKPAAEQSKQTAGPAVALRFSTFTAPGGLRATGSDVTLIDVEAIDAAGRRCPTFQQRVDFQLTGPAIWRGGYNSGKIKSTNNTYLDLECGINRVAIRSTLTPGTITLLATCPGLKPVSIEILCTPILFTNGCNPELPPTPPQAPLHKPTLESNSPTAAASSPKTSAGQFIRTFSYSGPDTRVAVIPHAAPNMPAYTDSDLTLPATLPPTLADADFIRASHQDRTYHAVDLMELSSPLPSTLYIAHDDRLPRPAWLKDYIDTHEKLLIGKTPLTLFSRPLPPNEGTTLGPNTEDRAQTTCLMYIVFVNKK